MNRFPETVDTLFVDCNLATMTGDQPYGAIHDAAIATIDGKIAWLGAVNDLPVNYAKRAEGIYPLNGAWMTPGLIDCHTHMLYAGDRAGEFEMRLNGASYAEIAQAGGGIVSTVNAVRNAKLMNLYTEAYLKVEGLSLHGVTTVEIKSGYGLSTDQELKMLRAIQHVRESAQIDVLPTFLGAHAVPPEFKGDPDGYIDLVCNEMIPAVAEKRVASAVDAFCENIGFSPAQTRRVFEAAKAKGLAVKLHAEQLSDQKGAVLAAEFGALSCDHLEYVQQDGIDAMARAGTVAVLLPGAYYFLKETQRPPVEALRRAGVPIALATDHNPGTSPTISPSLMMNMACILFGLTPEEALAGFTRNGARALGLQDEIGTLEAGKRADLAVWGIEQPAELAYRIGDHTCLMTVKDGVPLDYDLEDDLDFEPDDDGDYDYDYD